MTFEIYGNEYIKGYRWSFFGSRFIVEYELNHDRSFNPWFAVQLGGDHIAYKAFGCFGRCLSFQLFPRY